MTEKVNMTHKEANGYINFIESEVTKIEKENKTLALRVEELEGAIHIAVKNIKINKNTGENIAVYKVLFQAVDETLKEKS